MTQQEKEKLKEIPKEYRPVSAMTLFLYTLLYCIPIIGVISLFVCAFKAKRIQVRSYARHFFILYLVGLILGVALYALYVYALYMGFTAPVSMS